MHSPEVIFKAKRMRKEGTSLNEISSVLGVKKTTVSYWCRDIGLNESAIRRIKSKGKEKSVQGLLRYSEIKRKERIERDVIQKKGGGDMVGSFSDRDLLMVGLGLYWGEGYKEGELGFTNSNPKLIKFYLTWLRIFDISKQDLIFRLTINEVFKPIQSKIESFWLDFLNVDKNQFSKTTIIKTKLKKAFLRENHTYNGILRVKVRRGSALKNKILGAIEYISTKG
jgi:hypothetical protein